MTGGSAVYGVRRRRAGRGTIGDDADEQTRTDHGNRVQGREVRLTAQRILATHLHPGSDLDRTVDTYWPDTDIDLGQATLVDLNFDPSSDAASRRWTDGAPTAPTFYGEGRRICHGGIALERATIASHTMPAASSAVRLSQRGPVLRRSAR